MICCVPSETVGAMSIDSFTFEGKHSTSVYSSPRKTLSDPPAAVSTRATNVNTPPSGPRFRIASHFIPSPCVSLFPNQCGMSLIVTRNAGRAAFFGL